MKTTQSDRPTLKILLIEDDEDDYIITRELIHRFEQWRSTLEWAQSFEDGVQAMERGGHDVCLLDFRLGEREGLDLLRHACTGGYEVPVIFLTGQEQREADIAAMEAGASDYLIKARLDVTQLERSIRYAMQHKASEVALQQAHLFAQATVDALPDNIAVLNGDGVIIATNAAWRTFAEANGYPGLTAGVGANYLTLWDAIDNEASRSVITGIRAVLDGQQELFSLEYACRDLPEERWFEIRATPFAGSGPLFIVVALEEISRRKQAEALLRRSEERYRSLTLATPEIVWTSNADGTGGEMADWLTYTGQSYEEAQGWGWAEPIHPDDRPRVEQKWADSVRHKKAYDIEFRLRSAAGEYRLFAVRGVPVVESDGCIREWIGTCTDIHDKTQAEQALRESEARFSTAFEYAAIGMALVDTSGRWLKVNQSLCELLGYTATELSLLTFQEITHPDDLDADLEHLRQMLTGETRFYSMEKRYFHKQGHVLWILLGVSLVRDAEGQPLHFVSQIQDITARKQHDEALRNSEAELRALAEAMPQIVWVARPDGWHLHFNQRWIDFTGLTLEESLGFGWNPPFHPEDRPRAAKLWQYATESGEPYEIEYRLRRADGVYRWMLGRALPLYDAAGAIVKWFGTCTDIDDLKHAEAIAHEREREQRELASQLETERARLAEAHAVAKVGSWELDLSTNVLVWSEENCRIFGSDPDQPDVTFETFAQRIHPEDRAAVLEAFTESVANHTSYKIDHRLLLEDGTVKFVHERCQTFYDENGRPLRSVGTTQDITQRKETENALRRMRDELELRVAQRTAELEASNQALLDNEARLLQGNSIFTELTGFRVASDDELKAALSQITEAGTALLGVERCSVWLYNPEATAICCLDLYQRQQQSHVRGLELSVEQYPAYFASLSAGRVIVAEDAHTHPATHEFSEPYLAPLGISSMMDAPIFIDGRMAGVLCCEHVGEARRWQIEDQTFLASIASICALALESAERTRAEAALRQAKEDAESARVEADAANAAKGEFLSRLSHELRTPLNAILGFGQLLEKGELPPRQKEGVKHILKGGNHLLGLVNEILDITRVEAGHSELSIEPIAVNDVIAEACTLLGPLTLSRNIQLDCCAAASANCYVLADYQRLKQILINLLSNGIKYNHEGGQLIVSCDFAPDERVRIAVRDTGPGIAAKDLSKLFTPFERLNAAHSEIEGSGLGLVLSRRLVTAMSGTLEVESSSGAGSTFIIELPQAATPVETMAKSQQDEFAGDGEESKPGQHFVLCIEDNPSNLRLVEAILEDRPGLTLLTAMQGNVGLDMARRHRPALILLDLNLPDVTGWEILTQLQEDEITANIPVIVISADATPSQIKHLFAAGATAYLTKPLDVTEFLSTLDTALKETALIAQNQASKVLVGSVWRT